MITVEKLCTGNMCCDRITNRFEIQGLSKTKKTVLKGKKTTMSFPHLKVKSLNCRELENTGYIFLIPDH